MKTPKRLGASFVLLLILAVATLAGETPTVPSATEPGTTQTPPSSSAPMTCDANATGILETPPADGAEATALAMDLVQSMLSIF